MENSEEVVALYEYSAQLPDELSLRVGDVITRVERMEGGWWRGELAGNTGMFPDNFVKVRLLVVLVLREREREESQRRVRGEKAVSYVPVVRPQCEPGLARLQREAT